MVGSMSRSSPPAETMPACRPPPTTSWLSPCPTPRHVLTISSRWIMKLEHEQVGSSQHSINSSRPLDRRRFLESAAVVGSIAWFAEGIPARAAKPSSSSLADSRLPDGTEFAMWEQPLTFSKTYYVDNTAPNADDNGPGDRQRPFRTINK